ncbi:hypothetical protein PSAB6_30212 [Paraburkholderia sabiae]|nr:hypothetical protein PSAB6_30212 [Paraburkholderia sabiae]
MSCRAATQHSVESPQSSARSAKDDIHLEHIRSAGFLHLPSVDRGGMCSKLCAGFSRRARLTAGFLRSAEVVARQLNCGVPQHYPGRHRSYKSGFLLPTFLCRCKEK